MTHDPHTLTGAYALDALDEEERHLFEEHLSTCEACAEEVRGLSATAARLGADATTRPAESLHRKVMDDIRVTRQLPPMPSVTDTGGAVRRPRSRSRLLIAVAAALLVVAGGLGTVAISEQRRAARAEQAVGQLAGLLGAPDARTFSVSGSAGSSARVVFSPGQGRAVFVPHGMTAQHGRDLQLWVIRDGTYRSAGLLQDGRPLVTDKVEAASVLGVTVEPAGGSPQPTSAPILQVRLA